MATSAAESVAQSYAARRRVAALIGGEPAPIPEPLCRARRSGVAGVVLAAVTMVATALVGLLTGISTESIPDNGAVAVKDTQDRYVVIDGVVHPALNLSSAMLGGGGTFTTVGAAAIARAPKGPPVGIPGAPDVLPDADRLATGPWTVCISGDPPRLDLLIGVPPPRPLGPGAAIAVRDGAGESWLLAADGRYRLAASTVALLGLGDSPAVPLPDALLEIVPVRATAASANRSAPPFDLVVAPQSRLCLSISAGSEQIAPGQVSVAMPPALPTAPGVVPVTTGSPVVAGSPDAAGSVTIAGSGALVYDASDTDDAAAARRYFLVTDSAIRYPLGSEEAVARLGYDPQRARGVPAGLLELIPSGPTLDIDAVLSSG